MIKRQFYKLDHDNDRDDISDSSSSSSSSSDSESEVPEAQAEEEEEEDDDDVDDEEVVEGETDAFSEPIEDEQPSSLSSGSGYKSEGSSEDEVEFGSAGLLVSDDEDETTNGRHDLKDSGLMGKSNTKTGETKSDAADDDSAFCILQCGAVFKCRICPRIVCLSEETLRAHLVSKRHARSKKLLSEGRLKLMLNSDGEVEEDPETHAERHARILALAQKPTNLKKKNRGRQRQRLRLKRKKSGDDSDQEKEKQSVKKNKKMRKNEDALQKLGDDSGKGKEKQSVKKNKKMRKNEDASQKLGDDSGKGKEKQSVKKNKKMRKNEDASQKLGDVSDKGKEKQSLKRKTKKMRKNED